jgi:hypothetical protein
MAALDGLHTAHLLTCSPARVAFARFLEQPGDDSTAVQQVPPLTLDVCVLAEPCVLEYARVKAHNDEAVLRCAYPVQVPAYWLLVGAGGLVIAALLDLLLPAGVHARLLPDAFVTLAHRAQELAHSTAAPIDVQRLPDAYVARATRAQGLANSAAAPVDVPRLPVAGDAPVPTAPVFVELAPLHAQLYETDGVHLLDGGSEHAPPVDKLCDEDPTAPI